MKRGNGNPQQLRKELQEGGGSDLRLRRAIVGVSLIGMASMAVVSLFQMGIIKHLPDPPLRRFDSDTVNASETAYQYGVPDGTLTLAAHATNVTMAAFGGTHRAEECPWIPIVAAGKAATEAAVAGKYLFYQMPVVEKAWCGYCIIDAVMHLGAFRPHLAGSVESVFHRAEQRQRQRVKREALEVSYVPV